MRNLNTSLLYSRSCSSLNNISVLHLSSSKISVITDCIKECVKLRHLYLDNNKLRSFDEIYTLQYLWILDLSNNQLNNLKDLANSCHALGYLSLSKNNLSFESLLLLHDMPIIELEISENPLIELNYNNYLKLISYVPSVWIINGNYITYDDRIESIKKHSNHINNLLSDVVDKYGSINTKYQFENNPLDSSICEFLRILNQEPHKNERIDIYRLNYIAKYYNEKCHYHNNYCKFSPKLPNKNHTVHGNRLPLLNEKYICENLTYKNQLELAIIISIMIEFNVPRFIISEALCIHYEQNVLPPKIIYDICRLKPFALITLLHLILGRHIDFNAAHLSSDEYNLWYSINPIYQTLSSSFPLQASEISSYSKNCRSNKDKMNRCYQAVIILSRSPSFPTILNQEMSAKMKRLYKQLYPLLKEAGVVMHSNHSESILNETLFNKKNEDNSIWIGGHYELSLPVETRNKLDRNKDYTQIIRAYDRPWNKNEVKETKIEKGIYQEKENLNRIKYLFRPPKVGEFFEIDYRKYTTIEVVLKDSLRVKLKSFKNQNDYPFLGRLIVDIHDMFRMSNKIWRHRLIRMKQSNKTMKSSKIIRKLDRSSASFRGNGDGVSTGITNNNIHKLVFSDDLRKPKPVAIFSTNTAWDSNFVLAPPSHVKAQDFQMNHSQASPWSKIEYADCVKSEYSVKTNFLLHNEPSLTKKLKPIEDNKNSVTAVTNISSLGMNELQNEMQNILGIDSKSNESAYEQLCKKKKNLLSNNDDNDIVTKHNLSHCKNIKNNSIRRGITRNSSKKNAYQSIHPTWHMIPSKPKYIV